MKNKKIMFFARFLDEGGATRVISELSLNLPNNIERVIVLLENRISYSYQGKLIVLNLPFSKNLFIKFFRFLKMLFKFRKVVKKETPDYVVSSGAMNAVVNILTNKKAVVRVGVYLSKKSRRTFRDRIYNILVRILFNRTAKIVVISKGIEDDLIENFGIKPEKIKVIYNPLDFKKIKKLAEESLDTSYQEIFRKPVVINMGQLNDQKGQWNLIRAFGEVKKRNKDLKLVILGEGEFRTYLEKLIRNLNLKNDVFLLGWQKNPYKFLLRSKLFVLSSFSEGLGNAILEAMACGIPVVSTDGPTGPREILAPDTKPDYRTNKIEYAPYGILVPVCDNKFYGAEEPLTVEEKLLSKTMEEIFINKKLYSNLIEKSKERSRDFETKKIIKNWDFLWE